MERTLEIIRLPNLKNRQLKEGTKISCDRTISVMTMEMIIEEINKGVDIITEKTCKNIKDYQWISKEFKDDLKIYTNKIKQAIEIEFNYTLKLQDCRNKVNEYIERTEKVKECLEILKSNDKGPIHDIIMESGVEDIFDTKEEYIILFSAYSEYIRCK